MAGLVLIALKEQDSEVEQIAVGFVQLNEVNTYKITITVPVLKPLPPLPL